jgi:hypothetical protein
MMCIIVGTNLHESARILGFGTQLDFASFRVNSARFVARLLGSIPGASTVFAPAQRGRHHSPGISLFARLRRGSAPSPMQ